MKINAKKILGALGLMGAGAALALVETARELTVAKDAQKNRDFMRVLFEGYENGTLEVKPAGFGKVQASCIRWEKPSE